MVLTIKDDEAVSMPRMHDSFAQDLSAAGWHLEIVPGKERPTDLNDEVRRLQEALSRLKEAQQPYQRPQKPASSTSSLAFTSSDSSRQLSTASSRQLYDQSSKDRAIPTATPLLSPLYSYNSFTSTPSMSIGGDQTPESSTSLSSQLVWSSEPEKAGPIPLLRRAPPTKKKIKSVQFSDVEFRTEQIANREISREEAVEILVKEFPELCEAPARMYGPDGQPLPPTKKQEISQEERKARKQAIQMQYKGSVAHSLLKVSVLLETRNIIWRRVEGLTNAQQRPVAQTLDKTTLDPWLIELNHGDIDISEMAKNRLRKMFELKNSHKVGQCDGCSGTKTEACHRCKGSTPDKCWWCKGSGKASGESCNQCSGKGIMACRACQGSITITCSRCQGQGRCLFSAFLQVTMARVDLNPVPLSSIRKSNDERSIADICTENSREMVENILGSKDSQSEERQISRPSRAHRIIATMNSSSSHLVQIEIPRAGRLVVKKNTAPLLRPNYFFQRKLSFLPVYFIIPSDPNLSPVQVSTEDFQASLSETTSQITTPTNDFHEAHLNAPLQLPFTSSSTSSSLAIPTQLLSPEFVE